tara:strand:+ start:689 stop:862 length:174 start_codon:yes stop_codon:yes gene_type:complete
MDSLNISLVFYYSNFYTYTISQYNKERFVAKIFKSFTKKYSLRLKVVIEKNDTICAL